MEMCTVLTVFNLPTAFDAFDAVDHANVWLAIGSTCRLNL